MIFFSASVAQAAKANFNSDDERIMEVTMGTFVLDTGLVIYPFQNDWMIPLGDFTEGLDFAIQTSPALGVAEGFFIEESRRFKLDTHSCEVHYGDKHETYDCREVVVYNGEIYVDRDLLQRWFPVNITVNSLLSEISVEPREPLPVQLRKEREQLAARTKGIRGEYDPGYPRIALPYRLFEGPTFDEQLSMGKQQTSGGHQFTLQHSTQIGAEMMGLEGLATLNGDQHSIQNMRFGLARRSEDGSLFGPLHAREVQMFSVTTPAIPLLANARDGTGFVISSFPLLQPDSFQSQSFQGDLPAGWEVDLYRNEVLLDRQVSNGGGRYFFQNIPLLYGKNVFRLTFWGPQGQRRDEYQTFNISPDLIQPGTHDYRLGISQLSNGGPQRFTFQYAENFSKYFTANATVLQDQQGGNGSFGMVGLNGVNRLFIFSTNCAFGTSGGEACQWREQMGIGDSLNLGTSYTQLNNFHSDVFNPNPTDNQTGQLDADLTYIFPTAPALSTDIEVTKNYFPDQAAKSVLSNRLTLSAGAFYFNNTLVDNLGTPSPLQGQWEADYIPGSVAYRVALDYSASRATGVEAEINRSGTLYSWVLGGKYSFQGLPPNYSLTVNRLFDKCTVGVSSTYTDVHTYSLGMILSFGLEPDPRNFDWHFTRNSTSTMGSASALAFVDKNRNGVWDPDEKVLPGMKIALDQGDSGVKTDANGIAFLTGLRPYLPADLSIATDSLEDPYLLPEPAGARILPRPAKVAQVSLPLVVVGETDGMVGFQTKDGIMRPRRGMVVELWNAKGKIKTVKTDTDGYYQFEALAPGIYTLKLSEDQLVRQGISAKPSLRSVTIPAEGSFESGQDFVLQ